MHGVMRTGRFGKARGWRRMPMNGREERGGSGRENEGTGDGGRDQMKEEGKQEEDNQKVEKGIARRNTRER